MIAMLLCLIGVAWYNQGDLRQSRSYIDRGEKVLSQAGIVSGVVRASLKLQLCHVYWLEGNYVETKKVANEALKMFSDLMNLENEEQNENIYLSLAKRTLSNHSVDIGKIYTLLGITEGSIGRCSEALSYLNKALSIAEQYNDQQGIAIISLNMGDLYAKTANYAQAHVSLRRARSLAELIKGRPVASFVLINMGILDIRTGNLVEALDELKEFKLL